MAKPNCFINVANPTDVAQVVSNSTFSFIDMVKYSAPSNLAHFVFVLLKHVVYK